MPINSTSSSTLSPPLAVSLGVGAFSLFFFLLRSWLHRRRTPDHLSTVPRVAGALPLLGNLLQLKGMKPFLTFTNWAEIYGPIFSIQIGPSRFVVLSSTDVAKEAMVTRYDSMTHRDMTTALTVLSHNKTLVAISDHNDFYKMARRHLVSNLLGSKAVKQTQHLREFMLENITNNLANHAKSNPTEAINFREIFDLELFGLALKEAVGCDVQSLYVEELGSTLSRKEIYKVLVLDIVKGIAEVGLQDIFPYLRWIPFLSDMKKRMKHIDFKRMAVMKALINEHKRQSDTGQDMNCYYDYMQSQADIATLPETQITLLVWETISGRTDTNSLAVEWALFELAKDAKRQDMLYQEIQKICGTEKISEEHLPKLPYLSAIIHETLRIHPLAPVLPVRLVNQDTQIGRCYIPGGSKIMINLYGCSRDKKLWKDADEWIPERFFDNKYDPQDLFKTMAFGAGKRVCPGAALAMLVSCLTIGRLVQMFELRLNDEDQGDLDTAGLTAHKLHPLHLLINPRY